MDMDDKCILLDLVSYKHCLKVSFLLFATSYVIRPLKITIPPAADRLPDSWLIHSLELGGSKQSP